MILINKEEEAELLELVMGGLTQTLHHYNNNNSFLELRKLA